MARFHIRVSERETEDPASAGAVHGISAALNCLDLLEGSDQSAPALNCLDVVADQAASADELNPESPAPLAPLSE